MGQPGVHSDYDTPNILWPDELPTHDDGSNMSVTSTWSGLSPDHCSLRCVYGCVIQNDSSSGPGCSLLPYYVPVTGWGNWAK